MILRKRIGDLLLEAGLITTDHLGAALAEQQRTKEKIGAVLMRIAGLSEEQLLTCLTEQLDIARYAPERYPLDPDLAAALPLASAQELQAIPLSRQRQLLVVATPNPTDVDAFEKLERLTGLEVEPVLCTETEFTQLLGALYGVAGQFSELLETFDTPELTADAERERTHEIEAESLVDVASGAPTVRMVNWIIGQAVRLRASDIHLSPEGDFVRCRFRVDGNLRDMPSPPKAMFLAIISRFKLLSHMDISVSRVPQDGRFTARMNDRDYNLRASTVPTVYGENLVVRILDPESGPRSLDVLGLGSTERELVAHCIERPWGMILACGPTGSGKTTTLYTMLRSISAAESNIMTLEDPAEYRLPRVQQVQINHRAGMTFAQGLRAMLRQDPDVIMVGEIRDGETASIAVQAALTGHLVLSTIHTNDAIGAVSRLVDMGVPPFLVSSVMILVVSQRLIRRNCPDCTHPVPAPTPQLLRYLAMEEGDEATWRKGTGCNLCLNTGFMGRMGLYEVLTFDETLRDAISRGVSSLELRRVAQEHGLLSSLARDAGRKAASGQTSAEEAAAAVMY